MDPAAVHPAAGDRCRNLIKGHAIRVPGVTMLIILKVDQLLESVYMQQAYEAYERDDHEGCFEPGRRRPISSARR